MADREAPPPPFFLLGAARSGTTLLAAMLDSHSRLAVYGESHFYHYFRPHLHRYGDLARAPNLRRLLADVREVVRVQRRMEAPTAQELVDAVVVPTLEGVLAALVHLHARRRGKLRGGEKTPGHHAYLGEILAGFPWSPVVFLLRDPRDAALSMREAFGTSLRGAVEAWNQAFRSYETAAESVHLLRYEDLVAHPAARSAAVCAHLGEPYEPAILRYFERLRGISHTVPSHHRHILEPVDGRFVGRFRQMTRREIEWIERACAAGMDALGYEYACGQPRAGPTAPPGRATFFRDRLRFYALHRARWLRAWTRWRLVLRLRVRHLLSAIPGADR